MLPRKPLATLVGALVVMMGTVAPASAARVEESSADRAAVLADCPAGRLCAWQGPHFTGSRYEFPLVDRGECLPAFWFSIRSAYNRTGYTQKLWTNSNCTGYDLVISSGHAIDDTGVRRSVGGYP